jgi:hypothetical protein
VLDGQEEVANINSPLDDVSNLTYLKLFSPTKIILFSY